MNTMHHFDNKLTSENYETLRKLAQKLSYKDFHETTGFGQGIFTRLRKFPKLEEYKKYIAENQKKYSQKNRQNITLKVIYEKLLEIEKRLV